MYLIHLDSTNRVISATPVAHAQFLTSLNLSDGYYYMLAVNAPDVGQAFDPATQTFTIPPRRRWITNLAFDNRFTKAERVNIELASLVDSTMTLEQKRQALDLRVELERAKKATYTDLDREDTRAGVLAFEQFGLIGVGRALEILDASIQAHEYFPEA